MVLLLMTGACARVSYRVRPTMEVAPAAAQLEVVVTHTAHSQWYRGVHGERLLQPSEPFPEALALQAGFAEFLPAGWTVRGAVPPAQRVDLSCDYRLEFLELDPIRRVDAGDPFFGLWYVVSGVTLTLIPAVSPDLDFRSESWTVVRCADEAVVGTGEHRTRDLTTMAFFFTDYMQHRLEWSGDPFAMMQADHATEAAAQARARWDADREALLAQRRIDVTRTAAAWKAFVAAGDYRTYVRATQPPDWAWEAVDEQLRTPASAPTPTAPPPPVVVAGITPRATGAFASPFLADGRLANWTSSQVAGALAGQAAGTAASLATDAAVDQLAGQIPYVGGLLGNAAKKQMKDVAANAVEGAVSRRPADHHFDTACELAVYLHGAYATRADYQRGLEIVFAEYPELRAEHPRCLSGMSVDASVEPARSIDLEAQLTTLRDLLEQGVLTEAQFAEAVRLLLEPE